MKRPSHIWMFFCLLILIVVGTMAWISVVLVNLDNQRLASQRFAETEENIRLALWRMDSALGTIIARENARPWYTYTSFFSPPQTYTNMYVKLQPGEILLPSSLLAIDNPYIMLHFQFDVDGQLTSPQVPTGNMLDLASMNGLTKKQIAEARSNLKELSETIDQKKLLSSLNKVQPAQIQIETGYDQTDQQQIAQNKQLEENTKLRQQTLIQNDVGNRNQSFNPFNKGQLARSISKKSLFYRAPEQPLIPVWIDSSLLLARKVRINKSSVVQGCRLNWPALKSFLLNSIQDLLPEAKLLPASSQLGSRSLTALPIRLEPGPVPTTPVASMTPTKITLVVAWVCVLLSLVAVGGLVKGTLLLSQRRGAFVSAVTHELRTPLTTFRMYSEMLAEGMVTDPEKQKQYLVTLLRESDRLGHLVENVLEYSRLDRNGNKNRHVESRTIGEFTNSIRPRLQQRASLAGMTVTYEGSNEINKHKLQTDFSALEQILFNLIDNSCKYASGGSESVIHIQISRDHRQFVFLIRDHGPGIPAKEKSHIFQAFWRCSSDASHTVGGVGLGLTLCRQLADQLGGKLELDKSWTSGAGFKLSLPAK